MTAEFIQFLELKAYEIANGKQCLSKPRKNKRISMVELFDMLAGAETGSIIATTLAMKNDQANSKDQPNKYYADTVIRFFDATINELYYDIRMPVSLKVFIYLLLLGSFGSLAFFWTQKIFHKKGYED